MHKQPFLLCLERMNEGGWKVSPPSRAIVAHGICGGL